MEKVYLEVVRTIPISFRRIWGLEDVDFLEGSVTWAYKEDFLEEWDEDGPLVFIEDNTYQANFPAKYFKVIDEETYNEKTK